MATTPEECWIEATEALKAGKVEEANEWRLLGETIRNSQR